MSQEDYLSQGYYPIALMELARKLSWSIF